jgi:hypothetical protein
VPFSNQKAEFAKKSPILDSAAHSHEEFTQRWASCYTSLWQLNLLNSFVLALLNSCP